jgi:hypothetical protein
MPTSHTSGPNTLFSGSITAVRFKTSGLTDGTLTISSTSPGKTDYTSGNNTAGLTWPNSNAIAYDFFGAGSLSFSNKAVDDDEISLGQIHLAPRIGWLQGLVPTTNKSLIELDFTITSPTSTTFTMRFNMRLTAQNANLNRQLCLIEIDPQSWQSSFLIFEGVVYRFKFLRFKDVVQTLPPCNTRLVGEHSFGVWMNCNGSAEIIAKIENMGFTNPQTSTKKIERHMGRGMAKGIGRGMR